MINNKNKDKKIELERYEKRARNLLNKNKYFIKKYGSESMSHYLRTPYIFYEDSLKKIIKKDWNVLEIGSGNGVHTKSLIETNASITVYDISKYPLKIIKNNFKRSKNSFKAKIADIEKLPFKDRAFDLVASAGSLSYGDSLKVDSEIRRIIKPGGVFICVDSLSSNPIYNLNRYIHFIRGKRSKITLKNMPSIKRIRSIKELYSSIEVRYFGSISFIMPLFRVIFGDKKSKAISDYTDNIFKIKKSAFKFVLIAKA